VERTIVKFSTTSLIMHVGVVTCRIISPYWWCHWAVRIPLTVRQQPHSPYSIWMYSVCMMQQVYMA